jgi:hypothetical protein
MVENLEIYHGNSFNYTFEMLEEDGVTPISLVGCTVRFWIGTTILESTSGVVITPSPLDTTGHVHVLVSNTLMAGLTEFEYPVSLEITYADGVVETVYSGILSIKDDGR